MSTTRATMDIGEWLIAHPAPVHRSELAAWTERVRDEVGDEGLPDLMELLAEGDLEVQYQAVAAARSLGAEVWADGEEPDVVWLVDLPGDDRQRTVHPKHQPPWRSTNGHP